jgi:hypothetical protein
MIELSEEKRGNILNRRQRFIKIAERRVNLLLENLNTLGKCSNKRNYEYSETDVSKIFREIERKTKEIKLLFQGRSNNKQKFKL